jgi:hypothetical protein
LSTAENLNIYRRDAAIRPALRLACWSRSSTPPSQHALPTRAAAGHDAPVHELLFSDPNWLTVEDHIDAEAIADRDEFGDFEVSYSDIASHDYYVLVQQSVDVITAFPGVTGAAHEDREMITVWGRDVDKAALRAELREWWTQQLDRP